MAAMTTGLLLIGHGTRNPDAIDEVAALCAMLRERLERPVGYSWVEHDLAPPAPVDAARGLVDEGAEELVTLPFLAFAAGHTKTDVPEELDPVREALPEVPLHHGTVLGLHPRLVDLARRRLAAAREAAGLPAEVPADEALLVTGPGSSDPDANGELAKAARFLAETSGHRWAEIAYAGVTWPKADAAARALHAAGFTTVTRFSWSLLAGILEQRVDGMVEEVCQETGLVAVDAGRFGPEPEMVDAVVDRFHEARHGKALSNCDLCQFRLPLPGREGRAGLPSAGGTGASVRADAAAIQEQRRDDPDYLNWKRA